MNYLQHSAYALWVTKAVARWTLFGLINNSHLTLNNPYVTSRFVQPAEVYIRGTISQQNRWRHLNEGWNGLKRDRPSSFWLSTSINTHNHVLFRVTKGLTYFCSSNLWQAWGQEQEVPGAQEADAAAGQSAPDRSVCMQLSGSQTPGLGKARLLFEG